MEIEVARFPASMHHKMRCLRIFSHPALMRNLCNKLSVEIPAIVANTQQPELLDGHLNYTLDSRLMNQRSELRVGRGTFRRDDERKAMSKLLSLDISSRPEWHPITPHRAGAQAKVTASYLPLIQSGKNRAFPHAIMSIQMSFSTTGHPSPCHVRRLRCS
ncbi:hypothetical protein BS47DRAFT_1397854 [Hydnum rufescens UP504]|uniref:Uncharacterized protein n=1 Tax=Hydnum rufescens UP504 TaxID=1448309 RepID=A0A9P6AM77_9AGAM|nr:hypothetical protein BS47DRAFT_1397854 [Hydnum rufescens UP504]